MHASGHLIIYLCWQANRLTDEQLLQQATPSATSGTDMWYSYINCFYYMGSRGFTFPLVKP